MNPDALVDYQRNKMKDNPYFPVNPQNYDKIEEYVITKKGLEELTILKRECIMGRGSDKQKALYIELLRLWATTNRSLDKLREWKKYLDMYVSDIIKARYSPDLEGEDYAMKNPNYNSKYMKSHNTWHKAVIAKCYELRASGV